MGKETIIIGSLNDSELKQTINSLVQHVEQGTQKMKTTFDSTIDGMKKKLSELGNQKLDLGGGSETRAKKQKAETQAVNETTAAYDKMASAMQNAARPKSARESYLAFMQGFKEQGNAIAQQIKSAEEALNKAIETRVADLTSKLSAARQKLNELNTELARQRMEAERTGNYSNYNAGLTRTQQAIEYQMKRIAELQREIANAPNTFGQQRADIEALRQKREQVLNTMKEETTVQQQAATITQQRVNQEQRVTDEIRRQAQAIRESEEWRTKGTYHYERTFTSKDGSLDSWTRVLSAKDSLSLEEQLLAIEKKISAEMQTRAAATQSNVAMEQQQNQASQQQLDTQRKISQEVEKQKKYVAPQTGIDESFRRMLANSLKIDKTSVLSAGSSINSLTAYLKQLKSAFDSLNSRSRDTAFGKQLREEIRATSREIQRLRNEASRPISLDSIIAVAPKTIDDIIYRIQQLNSYKRGLNITDPKQKVELAQVDTEINKLTNDLNKYMSTTQRVANANGALTRSWNYMKNRLAFYFTVGASTAFVKNLIQVRSEYEMNERALGILIDSAERGTEVFQELSQMALVSPYTLIELSAAAKQLTAYDVAARDVVDTTRRLADMAAAVGIPIERLTYALGQIKAYGHLNSRDARMFANAGIPLVKQLSEYYTELEGRMISTADVYDRIKKKAIDYNDVMNVITKMTDEGGKFFDFQAKMADTLKVRLANLTLAWNNMLNEIGQDQQGILTAGIGGLRKLFLHWRDINTMVRNVAITFGFFKGLQFIQLLINGQLAAKMGWVTLVGTKMTNMFISLGRSLWAVASNPFTWIAVAGAAFVSMCMAIYDADQAIRKFNKSVRDGAADNYKNIKEFLDQYKDVRDSLYTFKDVDLGGGKVSTEISGTQDINKDEAKKAWEAVREQIELTSKSSDTYIGKLLQIDNVSERLRQGFNILDNISEVNAALKELDDKTIDINQDWSQWWNLWTGFDGLIGNLKDLKGELDDVNEKFGDLGKAESLAKGTNDAQRYINDYQTALERFQADLKETTDSIIAFINGKGWGNDTDKINETFSNITNKIILENQLNPQEAYLLQLEMENARSAAAKEALEVRINDEKEALRAARDENAKAEVQSRLDTLNEELRMFDQNNGRGKVIWENFTKWMSEQHISELREKFRDMDAEEIAHLDFTKGEWYDWAQKTAAKYAKEHKLSYNDAFNYLNKWVKQANRWSIFIPLVISTEGGKSVYDTLTELDGLVDDADSKIERLTKQQEKLNQKQKEGVDVGKDLAAVNSELADAEKQKADAEAKGGIGKKAEKDAKAAAKDAEKARRKAEQDRKKQEREAARAQRQAESELQKALKNELSLIDKIRSAYQALTKEGASHAVALRGATSGFSATVKSINAVFAKWGIANFDPKKFAGISNPRELVNLLQSQLDRLMATGRAKPEEIKDLQVKIRDLRVDAQKYDLKKLTEGLNNELGRLKEEYELSVELDANPELGEMFTSMLGIDMESMPRTFGELFDKANDIAKEKLRELGVSVSDFDLMNTIIKPDANGMWRGLSTEGEMVKEIKKWQDTFRDMFKKNMEDTEKMLDEYVKKYGNYADKIAEIEADRLEKLKKLNEAYYTDEMRNLPEYLAKLSAIEQGAAREKGSVKLDEFKNSSLYIAMFENLRHTSTATLEMMRDKLQKLKKELGSLSPEQLKQVVKQFESIDNELLRRNPFKGLIKNVKDYAKAVGKEGKKAQQDFKVAQRKYDWEVETLAALKEQLAQKRAQDPLDKVSINYLENEVNEQEKKVAKLKEELQLAEQLNAQYNLMRQLMGSQWAAISKTIGVIADNLQSLAELRDTLEKEFGVKLGDTMNAIVDDLAKVGSGLSQITSSAQSGNIFGVVSGVVNTVSGIGDAVASIFGDGSARTKRINREIEKSVETVRKLNLAYKDLERAAEKALGTAETQARRASIANKELELAEMERQMALEKSKRSKDRDDDAIKEYEEKIQDLRYEIQDLKEDLISNLIGSDIKSAAEEFVDTWVEAWRAGETTLDAISKKMDEMIYNLIKKAATSAIVERIIRPLYAAIDEYTNAASEGGESLTTNELRALAVLSKNLGVEVDEALGAFYGNLENLGVITKDINDGSNNLSALQQGIQAITEDTAGALEGYMNGVSQQVYLQSDLLTQIRDAVVLFNTDVQLATMSQILLQLQSSYTVQMSIQGILEGWSSPNGMSIRAEII
jgi:DNA repair exonuclease SbcCD ATPase subunit